MHTRSVFVPALLVLAAGCNYHSSLLTQDGGPDGGALACAPPTHVLEVGPDLGCVSLEVAGGTDAACMGTFESIPSTHVLLHRLGDARVYYTIEVLEYDGGPCSETDRTCPRVARPDPGNPPCACAPATQHVLAASPVGAVPTTIATHLRLELREQSLFLTRADARYRITLCAEAGDPWPSFEGCTVDAEACEGLPAVGLDGVDEPRCFCAPRCESDADCFVPATGTAAPVCIPELEHSCFLRCASDAECPTGQVCTSYASGRTPSFDVCMWPAA